MLGSRGKKENLDSVRVCWSWRQNAKKNDDNPDGLREREASVGKQHTGKTSG